MKVKQLLFTLYHIKKLSVNTDLRTHTVPTRVDIVANMDTLLWTAHNGVMCGQTFKMFEAG